MHALTDLADKYESDKGVKFGHAHGYTTLYSFLFEQFRSEKFSMLEIGLQQGGVEAGNSIDRATTGVPSISMWMEYFPNAEIFGFDISDFSQFENERFHFLRGDAGSVGEVTKLRDKLPDLRIIVDDGSHASFHQQLSFYFLFDKVQDGGYYIIEDFHWQPPFEAELPHCLKTSEVFSRFLLNRELLIPFGAPTQLERIASKIDQVFMHHDRKGGVVDWQAKMVAIKKK